MPHSAISPPYIHARNITVPHGFFTRNGGVSEGVYRSLNVAYGSEDEARTVAINRERIAATFGCEETQLFTCQQIHSDRCITVTAGHDADQRPEADALVTTQRGILLGILTADCVPVLLHDSKAGVIGAAHAGWKGAFCGIIESTINAMCALGATPSGISAATGPAIMQYSYEVDASFYQRYVDYDALYKRYFIPSDQRRETHFMFDNIAFVHDRLSASGLKDSSNIDHDTYSNRGQYFSYRRATHEKASDYGRQLSVIMLPAE